MPPFGFRKRARSPSPSPGRNNISTPKRAKRTLLETTDGPSEKKNSVEDNRKFLDDLDDDDDETSLSEADSDEFEDVLPAKRFKTAAREVDADDEEEEDEGDDEMEWEDAIQPGSATQATPHALNTALEITDISVSMNDDGTYIEPLVSAATGKKGPSKRERHVRVLTHCFHVQALMLHNATRNSWLNDKEVQKALVAGLTDGVQREVQRWKDAMKMLGKSDVDVGPKKDAGANSKGNQVKKGKKKGSGRDWNEAAAYSEASPHGGDPTLRLLKVLAAYWKKRFLVTAPGLRKQGYKPLRRLRDEIRAWDKNRKDAEEYGERIEGVTEFRKLAKKCEGSRDVGAQLFVALLRGLGLEARMVANLQPAGIGWSKAEEADPKKTKKKQDGTKDAESESDEETPVKQTKTPVAGSTSKKDKKKDTKSSKAEKPTRKSSRGNKSDPINLDDSDSPLSSPPSESEEPQTEDEEEDDDISIIDITPPTPKKRPSKKYDRDMAYPNYWTEVCSPVTHKYYPVDPIVLSTIASNDELLQTFEPRGKKAEKAKQVICYTVGFSPDGTAKDVTVRYIKRHQLPGKTKGMRLGTEKIAIRNRKGKITKYVEQDWFREMMILYDRADDNRTAADDLEDQTDLKPYKPAKEAKPVTKESLQGYKQSADYVLEQHLRREEALLPGSKPVKYFTSGKGDNTQEHAVYSREDIVTCKTVESWHKDGRAVKMGEQPLKYVPVRAVTLGRKREMEDVQRETGEKMKQGLYSEAQTEWIIPPPIQDGIIPKNAFGNMDVYVPTMVPKGAVHLPLKGSAKLCRKLEIDYAEACTGFEFGKQRAVPVITGVVVAEGNAAMVRDAWRADQQEIKRKEDTKRTATSLHWWRKMLLGLRVLERMRTEYAETGGTEEDINPFVRKSRAVERGSTGPTEPIGVDEEMSGGFFRPGHEEEEVPQRAAGNHDQGDGGLSVEDDEGTNMGGGGFLIEDGSEAVTEPPSKNHAPITPISLQSIVNAADGGSDLDDAMDVDIKPKKAAKRGRNSAPSNGSSARSKQTNGKRKVAVSSSNEDESTPSTPPRSSDDEQLSEQEYSKPVRSASSKRSQRATSPAVVIKSNNRTAKKRTPVRSQYFKHDDDDEVDKESDAEVVKPRKTTARTKAKR